MDKMALHYLCITGNISQLELYLDKVSDASAILSQDAFGRRCLHCVASFKGPDVDALQCLQLILNKLARLWTASGYSNLDQDVRLLQFINEKDRAEHTALYYAVKVKHLLVCEALLKAGADWNLRDERGKPTILKIFKNLPELLNRLISKASLEYAQYTTSERNYISIDFRFVIGYPSISDLSTQKYSKYEEMRFLSNICYTTLPSRNLILSHPLIKLFIWLKWNNFIWFSLYIIFLVMVYRHDCPYNSAIQYNFSWFYDGTKQLVNKTLETNERGAEVEGCKVSIFVTTSSWILLTIACLEAAIFQVLPLVVRLRRFWYPFKKKKQKSLRKYSGRVKTICGTLFCDILHPFKWIFLISVFVNIGPVLVPNERVQFDDWQYVFASIGVGLTWYQILLQLGKISWLKVYIKMLLQVLANIFVVFLLYVSLIIAFAMVFCILLPGIPAFSSLYEALLKMSTFFIGEVDYEDTFYRQADNEKGKSISPSFCTAILFYGLGIVVLHLALFNFLISLTEVNVKEITKYSDTWANYNYIWQTFLIETFLASPTPKFPLLGQIKLRILKSLMLFNYKCYDELSRGRETTNSLVKEIRIDDLPKALRQEIHDLNLNVIKAQGTNTITNGNSI